MAWTALALRDEFPLGEGLRPGTTTSSQTSEDGQSSEQSPDEEAKSDSSLGDMAREVAVTVGANVGGESNRAGKPEERSETREAKTNDGVVEAGENAGDNGEVEEDEDGPDGVKEQEVDCRVVVVAGADGNEVGSETKLNDQEDQEDSVQDSGDSSFQIGRAHV